ncbi:MAG: NACHT domain-containing protein, partial [Acidobacteria bacterium]
MNERTPRPPASRRRPAAEAGGFNPFDEPRLLAYFEALADWHGYIRFLGLPHLRDNPDVPIDELYVEPSLADRHLRPEQADDQAHREDLLPTLAAHPRLVLLGDPGSGKSTLVSWLAWQLGRGRSSPVAEALGPLVPLPLIVRDLGIGRGVTWCSLLDAFLAQPVAAALAADRRLLDQLLEHGRALILLDGLDEIASEAVRRDLHAAVVDGFTRHPHCRWLLTSRQVGYEQVPFHLLSGLDLPEEPGETSPAQDGLVRWQAAEVDRLAAPSRLLGWEAAEKEGGVAAPGSPRRARGAWAAVRYVAPFSDGQIERFAAAWYARHETVAEKAAARAGDLVAAIHARGDTLCLARTPNLLTLMALIHRIQARLPHGRALLYGKIVEAYLESIDAFRGLEEVGYELAEKRRWLAAVGYRMQLRRAREHADDEKEAGDEGEILAAESDVVRWIEEAMAGSEEAEPGAAAAAARDFVAYV